MSEFAHRLTLDRIRDGDRLDLVADAQERQRIADRLDLASLERLDAHVVLHRDGDVVRASGRVKAALEQRCVATGDPIAARVDEAFDLRFIAEPVVPGGDAEFELDADELDTLFHDGQAIDLGAAIADSLALGLDPYPRSAGAAEALRAAGVISEEEAGPFAALAALKDKLGGGS